MKKKILKSLCLAWGLAFSMSVVAYCDTKNYKKESIILDNCIKNDNLFVAVVEEDLEKVKTLIECGVDVNFVKYNEFGQQESVLVRAIKLDNLEIVKLLIGNGANVNLETKCLPSDDDSICFTKPINAACYLGRNDIIRLLLANNVDINSDNLGNALMYACYGVGPLCNFRKCRQIETAKLLIENGANINFNNGSLLSCACFIDDLELAKLLIENGADVNLSNHWGTPLHCATEYGNYEVTKLLIENGADVNARNDDGATPLDSAMEGLSMKEYLKSSENIGDFCLMPDYNNGHIKIIKLLKDNGARNLTKQIKDSI